MLRYNKKTFTKQLTQDHKISLVKEYLQEVVYGGNDGIISTFVVVSGFTGAQNSEVLGSSLSLAALLLFGFANLIADAVSMALGNFLSIRADKDVYIDLADRELKRLHLEKDKEIAETKYILQGEGFTKDQSNKMAEIMAENRPFWLNFMLDRELALDNVLDENPYVTAVITFFSFIFFGFIPLMPFVFLSKASNPFMLSLLSTAIALLIIGIIRAYLTNKNVFRTTLEVLFVGMAASGISYYVGTLF